MKQVNALQQEIDQTTREIHEIEDQLTAIARLQLKHQDTSEDVAIRPHSASSGTTRLNQSTANDHKKKVNTLQMELSDKRRRLSDLEREISFYREQSTATSTILECNQQLDGLQLQQQELKQQRSALREKLAAMTATADSELHTAQQAKDEAAANYASGLTQSANTDTEAAQLQAASLALVAAQERHAATGTAIKALHDKMAGVEDEIQSTADSIEATKKAAIRAEAYELAAKWDKAAKQLLELGGKLWATRQAGGLQTAPMESLSLPLLSSYRSQSLQAKQLKQQAECFMKLDG